MLAKMIIRGQHFCQQVKVNDKKQEAVQRGWKLQIAMQMYSINADVMSTGVQLNSLNICTNYCVLQFKVQSCCL